VNLESQAIEAEIKAQIVAIADRLGIDAGDLQADEVIPASGLIDSAGLLELIAWFEGQYDLRIPTNELTIDNLGTLQSMAAYLRRRKGWAPAT
jgi:D-alanine--poly(phosphoribitol) ligase subunit 2